MITRDNYEEFFLLYTDNELSEAERHEVERFVTQHPDLREEWETLLECRIAPDSHVAFPDREALLKPEIEGSAFTGVLLSYIDGELSPEERARVESVIRQQPRVAIELGVLRQIVSQPDPAIVYPGKDSLYRPEKNRRIIPLPWLRVGIAAAFAGAIALVFLLQTKQETATPPNHAVARNHAQDSLVNTHKLAGPVTSEPTAALHLIEGQPKMQKDQSAQQLIHRPKTQSQDVAITNDKDVAMSDNKYVAMSNNKDVAVTAGKDSHPATFVRTPDPVATPNRIEPLPTVNDPGTAVNMASLVRPAVQKDIPKEQSSFASQALQDEANDQRNAVFIADESAAPNRSALRGIFRKLKRTLGKTADRDGDGNRQVTVGAFQVSID